MQIRKSFPFLNRWGPMHNGTRDCISSMPFAATIRPTLIVRYSSSKLFGCRCLFSSWILPLLQMKSPRTRLLPDIASQMIERTRLSFAPRIAGILVLGDNGDRGAIGIICQCQRKHEGKECEEIDSWVSNTTGWYMYLFDLFFKFRS